MDDYVYENQFHKGETSAKGNAVLWNFVKCMITFPDSMQSLMFRLYLWIVLPYYRSGLRLLYRAGHHFTLCRVAGIGKRIGICEAG